MIGTPITKPFEADLLYREALAAGLSLPGGMSSDSKTIYTLDAKGMPADMPAGFEAVYAAHDPMVAVQSQKAAEVERAAAFDEVKKTYDADMARIDQIMKDKLASSEERVKAIKDLAAMVKRGLRVAKR